MDNRKFDTYEEIRQSGITNMSDIPVVVKLSHRILSVRDCLDIMKNYSTYLKMNEEFKEMMKNEETK